MSEKISVSQSGLALTEREQHLLKVLVERYISEGEPVGSRALSRESGLELSPATIRNVMSDLEEYGLVSSPHTSAGRVPTVQGYRLFVDTLLKVNPLRGEELSDLQRRLGGSWDSQQLVGVASNLLSEVTHMAGVVTVPRREAAALRHIEFLPLSDRRVLVIMVVNEQEVQNRIIAMPRDYSVAELQQMANFLNQRFMGRSVLGVREELVREMREAREHMNQLMLSVVEIADQVFDAPVERDEDYVLAGQTNLMGFTELSDMTRLRELFEAFNEKREILSLLDHCLHAKGVQIYIGEESGYHELDHCSVVGAPYTVDNEVVGVLGVIGPTRMDYKRVIPIVDVTAKLLGAALNLKG